MEVKLNNVRSVPPAAKGSVGLNSHLVPPSTAAATPRPSPRPFEVSCVPMGTKRDADDTNLITIDPDPDDPDQDFESEDRKNVPTIRS